MECSQCKEDMKVADSYYSSPQDSTDVFVNRKMVCINPKCSNYAGTDLNNPKKFETLRDKVN
jgi:hypothetical protein